MGEPRRNSRKGLMLSLKRQVNDMGESWRLYRGDWQPSDSHCKYAKLKLDRIKQTLDKLEKAL